MHTFTMSYREMFAEDEWYHCFTRGIDKRDTFKDGNDGDRFIQQLYLSNTNKSLHRSNLGKKTISEIFSINLVDQFVAIGAFCLMPNHFHLILKPIVDKGVSRYMQKLGTAYTRYFNIKYERTGGLFVSPFRAKHLHTDLYFQHALQYVHCNPAELFEPKWKEGVVRDLPQLKKKLLGYTYSSFGTFNDPHHVLRKLIHPSTFQVETQSDPNTILENAREYYEELHQGEALM